MFYLCHCTKLLYTPGSPSSTELSTFKSNSMPLRAFTKSVCTEWDQGHLRKKGTADFQILISFFPPNTVMYGCVLTEDGIYWVGGKCSADRTDVLPGRSIYKVNWGDQLGHILERDTMHWKRVKGWSRRGSECEGEKCGGLECQRSLSHSSIVLCTLAPAVHWDWGPWHCQNF